MTEINLVCPLCEQAMADRDVELAAATDKCAFCIAYHQLGGCREVCAEISTRVAERDWETARAIADDFIARLERLELPPAPGGVAPPPR